MNSRLVTPAASTLVLADRLSDWSGMAHGAFSRNTIRAWKADWVSRGVTVGDLRDIVNPSLGRTHAFDG